MCMYVFEQRLKFKQTHYHIDEKLHSKNERDDILTCLPPPYP